jgi:hypothetical protein
MSCGNRLKDAARFSQVIDVSLFRMPGDFIQPANRRRFEASLRWIVGRVNDFNFHLDGELTALHPSFAFFSTILHGHYSGK